jgi:hypothetical protein
MRWVRMVVSGKLMPIDWLPDPKGNVVMVQQEPPLARMLRPGEEAGPNERFLSHFATCPRAPAFRRRS